MPERRYQPTIDQDVADHGVRIDRQEKKVGPRPPAVPVNLDQLKDVAIPYRNADKAPKDGQLFRFHADPSVPTYGGWWEPAGGARIAGKQTLTITSDGVDAGATKVLVPSDWDEHQGCTGAVSVALTTTPAPLASLGGDFDGDPFALMLQVVPWDVSAGPPSGDTFSPDDIFPTISNFGVGGFATRNLSVPAVLMSGKPHAFVFIRTPPGVGALDFEVRWSIRPDGPL